MIPQNITRSLLWKKLDGDDDLEKTIVEIRTVAEALGAKISILLPEYTDHSLKHMDALWKICDQIFTPEEMGLFSPGEAFVLGSTFYTHDLGMAMPATKEGLAKIRESENYKLTYEHLHNVKNYPEKEANLTAVKASIRALHAESSREMVKEVIPGLGRYLIESTEIRNDWSDFIGDISESHQWSLNEVDQKLGNRGKIPDAKGNEIDLGFLACALRVIDYAHINSERAWYLERLLRKSIPYQSIIHWKAQEVIKGPIRENDRLKYGSTKPINDVDAWWLFYEMAAGLDQEIVSSSEYLSRRASSIGRFSLEGVKGVRTPQSFSEFVRPGGFEPVDVRFHPDSIERLVRLLGGESLYKEDKFAPIRELLQNARDAILLQRAIDKDSNVSTGPERINIVLNTKKKPATISINDSGIGMSGNIITRYLLGIAADYWNSEDFHSSYPGVASAGFKPAGRYGIGFLSSFMLGERIKVETQRRGETHYILNITGIERQGALVSGTGNIQGTKVTIELNEKYRTELKDFKEIVQIRAPMLDIPIEVNENEKLEAITPGWWRELGQNQIIDFVACWHQVAFGQQKSKEAWHPRYARRFMVSSYFLTDFESFSQVDSLLTWPGLQPEDVGDDRRIIAIPWADSILLCSNGLAVGVFPMNGLLGIVDIGDIKLDAARATPLNWDKKSFKEQVVNRLQKKLIEALDSLESEGRVPSRFDFLCQVGRAYGYKFLNDTKLRWITKIEPPGSAILISSTDFKRDLSDADEILIGFGVGPWSMNTVPYKDHFPDASPKALLVPISDKGQPSFGSYKDGDNPIIEPLPSHFEETSRGHLSDASLLMAILNNISEAWKTDISNLYNAPWSRMKDRSLCGHLIKKEIAK